MLASKLNSTENSSTTDKQQILTQELKFARLLAGNDAKVRNVVLKNLKKWLKSRSLSSYQFTNKEFMRLWKGLFYCMWMSDKPLVQEELAEELGSLVHCFPDAKVGLQFFRTFLDTMVAEFNKLDSWRMDKFMMLIRRVTRQAFFVLKNSDWSEETIKVFGEALEKTVLQEHKCPKGLIMHICDLYLEELTKVADGDVPEDKVHLLLEPFMIYYSKLGDSMLLGYVKKTIFYQLLFQSELGQDYEERFDVWKRANFPTKSLDDIEIKYKIQKVNQRNDDDLSDGEEEDENDRVLDPRAGRVNVHLSEIRFDALKIAETFENLRYKAFASTKSRKSIADLAIKYRRFADGIFPIGVRTMPQIQNENDSDVDIDLKAMELAEFEKKLALGDGESDSDVGTDLEKRRKGKLKRKSSSDVTKVKQKKQKLSKLHNSRFFNDNLSESNWEIEDFTKESQDNNLEEEKDDDPVRDETPKKSKSDAKVKEKSENLKILKAKRDKRKSLPNIKLTEDKVNPGTRKFDEVECADESPKKAAKIDETSTPSQQMPKKKNKAKQQQPFSINDEWDEPLKDGELEIFVPSQKTRVKLANEKLQQESEAKEESQQLASTSKLSPNLVRNPFSTPTISSQVKKLKMAASSSSTGKRVTIALNRNKAQHPHEYIRQVKESPNVPFDSTKKPTKSLLKPNFVPSPINPFYQKKIGFKLNDTL